MSEYYVIAKDPITKARLKALVISYTPPKYNDLDECVMLATCSVMFACDKKQWNISPRDCRILGERDKHPFCKDKEYRITENALRKATEQLKRRGRNADNA